MINYKVVTGKEMAYRVWDKVMNEYDNTIVIDNEGNLIKLDDGMLGSLVENTNRYEIRKF